MIKLSLRTQMLAQRLAAARGISLEEAVKLALEQSGKELLGSSGIRRRLTKDELINRLEEISARCGARPLIDPRSPGELLGYDDYGLPLR
jgi:antitoxin VapB